MTNKKYNKSDYREVSRLLGKNYSVAVISHKLKIPKSTIYRWRKKIDPVKNSNPPATKINIDKNLIKDITKIWNNL
ncbi:MULTISPECIES: hypothetical protein [Lactobacillaceae]|nr:hypothetical protein [Lentilactobacillus hilgardii]MBZ2201944.1 hypothetical protein [Lentilactobacillus hilgardii]MBZ2204119.1 hypothetical protein [Lentilactobacillus hilgardii]MCT3399633.1 hypothetical protein [Lentilactobacillus hilgardii]